MPRQILIFSILQSGQLAEIQKVSLARIICDNSDGTIRQIQPKAFRTPNEYEFLN
jgi:peroxidase